MGLCCSESNENVEEMLANDSISLCLLTWNVNAQPPSESLYDLIYHKNAPSFDIYVIGLQEIVDLNAKNLIVTNDAHVAWENKIDSVLNPAAKSKHYNKRRKYEYVRLHSICLVGIALIIYVKHNIWLQISDLMSSKCASGLFDIAGNKGAVAVRFNLYETSMCFVCCHFAAHKRNLKGRNTDYHKIIQKLTFLSAEMEDEYENNELSVSGASGYSHGKRSNICGLSILQHDIVYFMGDINYRLDFDDLDEVYQLIREQKWAQLLEKDQLSHQIESGFAFADFNEELIEFRPTFKYLVGTNEYEQIKKRTPSYCDRILWKIRRNKKRTQTDLEQEQRNEEKEKEKNVFCIRYNCAMEPKISDHKPVYGLFEIQLN